MHAVSTDGAGASIAPSDRGRQIRRGRKLVRQLDKLARTASLVPGVHGRACDFFVAVADTAEARLGEIYGPEYLEMLRRGFLP